MSAVKIAPLTVEDYRELPEAGPRYQLIEGELFMVPARNRYHQDISGNIYLMLAKYLEKQPGGSLGLLLVQGLSAEPELKGTAIELAAHIASIPGAVVITAEGEANAQADKATITLRVVTEGKDRDIHRNSF